MGSWLLLLGSLFLPSGTNPASVTGVVRDGETGAPVAGAVVALPDLNRTCLSDSLGRFLLDRISEGSYQLTVRRLGYAPWTIQVLVPSEGTLSVDFALRPEPVPVPEIQVRAPELSSVRPPPIDPGAGLGFPGRSLTSTQVRDHPLLAEPDYFAGLAGGEVLLAPETPEGFHIAGGASDQVAFELDGIPVFNPYHAAGTFGAWNPDVVAAATLGNNLTGSPSTVLGGIVEGRTRMPSDQVELRGGFSASQTRLALSAPMGPNGGGLLVGLRAGFPGLLGHKTEASHLAGRDHDWTAKLDLPVLGGRLSLLGYGSGNHLGASTADALLPTPPPDLQHHRFGWNSGSYGADWAGPLGGRLMQIRAWGATTGARVRWIGDQRTEFLKANRRDIGISANIRDTGPRSSTSLGMSLAASRKEYQLRDSAMSGFGMELTGDLPVATLGVDHRHRFTDRAGFQLSLSATATSEQTVLGPGAGLWWRPAPAVILSVSYTRSHQLTQSLRNPESVVGAVFPVELTVTGGAAGIPLARGDLEVFAVDYQPADGIRLGARAYARDAGGLALVALDESGPFAEGPVAVGSSSTRGAVLEFEARRSRVALQASYGYQFTRMTAAGTRYQPAAAAPHAFDAGLTVSPGRNWSVSLGLTGEIGRRSTMITGPFEWEACNLTDRGCEFIGSPETTGSLGAVRLPAYYRLDLGLRHEWRASLLGRNGTLAAFGTVTNLLGRRNILTIKENPTSGLRRPVVMRPRAPLAFGLDWRF